VSGLWAAGNNVVFWLLASALLDDGFRSRPWHADLVEERRRLRPFIVGASSLCIAVTALSQFLAGRRAPASSARWPCWRSPARSSGRCFG